MTEGSCYPLNRYGSYLQCVASPGKDYNYFGGEYDHPFKSNRHKKKKPPKIFFLLFKIKIKIVGSITPPPPKKKKKKILPTQKKSFF